MNKIKAALRGSNFLTRVDLILKSITEQEVEEFCKHYGLQFSFNSRVGGIVFTKDEELVTNFKSIFNEQNSNKK